MYFKTAIIILIDYFAWSEVNKMSLGFLGYAKLSEEDEKYAIYLYSGENWNSAHSVSGDALLFDGEIHIKKSSLEEPEIHQKLKKMPNHRKKMITKRITHVPNIQQKIADGDIRILKPCKNEFCRYGADGYIALMLLYRIFEKYQEIGKLPQNAEFIQ
jgi:hypothetical protein